LVIFRDLTSGIVVGFALGGLVFIHRMSEASSVNQEPDEAPESRNGALIYKLHGPYFFGAAAKLGIVLDQLAEAPKGLIVDFSDVPFIDSTGARSFELLALKLAGKGERLFLIGARAEVASVLEKAGVKAPEALILPDLAAVDQAVAQA
jgi:SulP family sulfate permease